MEIRNARIGMVTLKHEKDGTFTCYLYLNCGTENRKFGGNILDMGGADFLIKILDVAGVRNWEDLEGKSIRVKADSSKIYAIGNYLEDKWFELE